MTLKLKAVCPHKGQGGVRRRGAGVAAKAALRRRRCRLGAGGAAQGGAARGGAERGGAGRGGAVTV